MMSMEALKRLMAPAFFLLLFLLPAVYVDDAILQVSSHLLQRAIRIGHYVIGIGLWLTLAWLSIRVVEVMVWPLVIERQLSRTAPQLLKDFVRLLVSVVALGAIISEVFEASISGFLAASGVAGLVLGFALRSMIADFFSGIALNLERSFSIGDHIKLETGVDGEVVEINWRTTVLRNLPGNHIIVPNSKISEMRIENFSRPENQHLMWSMLTLDFDVPVPRAERILTAAATQAQAAIGGGGTPFARVRDITERGAEYIVVYSVPDWRRRERSRSEVTRHIMHHLSVAGIRLPNPKYDIYTGELSPRQLDHQHGDVHVLLKHISLFIPLDDSEVAALAKQMKTHLFSVGDVIVKQGDVGASMYIVAEGLLSVTVDREEAGDAIQVNQLIPGEFFGEISLLTGEPRTATVKAEVNSLVYEITKEAMALILEKRPEIAEQLTQVIAHHRLHTADAMKTLSIEQQEVEIQHFAAQLLQKMRRFFSAFRSSVAEHYQA